MGFARPLHLAPFLLALVGFDLAVAAARHAAESDGGFLVPLFALPLGWACLYGRRRHVVASLAGLAVALGAPMALIGAPRYPASGAGEAAIWLATAAVVSIPLQRHVARLGKRAAGFVSLVDAAQDAFIALDDGVRVAEWSPRAELLFGWPREEAVGREVADLIGPAEGRDELRQAFRGSAAAGWDEPFERHAEAVVAHRSGRRFPVEMTLAPVWEDGRCVVNAFLQDVSERRQAEGALREAEERFRRAFSDSAIGMAIASPEGRWIAFNTALGKLTGHPPEKLLGMRFSDIIHPEDGDDDAEMFGGLVAGERDVLQGERRFIHADGHLVWVGMTVSAIRDESGKTLYLVAQMQDVTERRGTEARLEHQALHDALTGLPNRILFDDRATRARERLRRGGEPFALLFVDLDRFKQMNDKRGHEFGDRLLVAAGERLTRVLRATDTAARFGGDEFTLLCEGVDDEGARHIGNRIVEAFDEPFGDPGDPVRLTASVGMCVVRDPEIDLKRAMRQADAAMYAAKSHGRARWALYREPDDAEKEGEAEQESTEESSGSAKATEASA